MQKAYHGVNIRRICLIQASKEISSINRTAKMTTFESISNVYSIDPYDYLLTILTSPLISYDSVSSDLDRLAKTKNFTMFDRDLAANELPQWMFITPNMTNDGHDSSIV